ERWPGRAAAPSVWDLCRRAAPMPHLAVLAGESGQPEQLELRGDALPRNEPRAAICPREDRSPAGCEGLAGPSADFVPAVPRSIRLAGPLAGRVRRRRRRQTRDEMQLAFKHPPRPPRINPQAIDPFLDDESLPLE